MMSVVIFSVSSLKSEQKLNEVCVSAPSKSTVSCWRSTGLLDMQKVGKKACWEPQGAAEFLFFFPECVARVPVSFGGLGVRLCSRKVVCMFATVRNRLRDRRKALHSGECIRAGPESVWSWSVVVAVILESAEEMSVWVIGFAAVIFAFAEEVSVWAICVAAVILESAEEMSVWVIGFAAVILAFAEEVSVWAICVAAVILSLQRRCLCEWSVSPQLQVYWCLQRRCLCEWSVSPQLYWHLQRKCLCEWSVSPQLYWQLQRRCLCERSVSPQWYWHLQRKSLCECRSYIGICRGGVCVSDLCRRSYIGICRGSVCVSDLCRRSYFGVCRRRCLCEWSVSPQFYWYL